MIIIKNDLVKIQALRKKIEDINSDYVIKEKQVGFIKVINFQHLSGEDNYAMATFEDFLVIADEHHNVTEKIMKTSKEFERTLIVSVGDTAGVEIIEYWERDGMKRKFSNGLDSYKENIEKLKDQIPADEYGKMIQGDYDIGEPKWFEKNGKGIHQILETYGISENQFWILKWDIYKYN